MDGLSKWLLTDDEKNKFIMALTPELTLLRTKADISQGELASLIGISRQTYGAIERGARKMTWNTYLSLILFYDYNKNTHKMIRALGAFPHDVIKRFNDGDDPFKLSVDAFFGDKSENIMKNLDEQALRSIRTLIMVEYARCTETPGEAVIKAFDGVDFSSTISADAETAKALKSIKEKNQ